MKKNYSKIKLIKVIFIGLQIIGLVAMWLTPRRIFDFIRGQRREIKELGRGDEDWRRFLLDSKTLVKNLFIPGVDNDHRPKILRPNSLTLMASLAITAKVLVTSFLFLTYPTTAELSAIVSSTMVKLINESRHEASAEPLIENSSLIKYAAIKGTDMLERDYFAHDTPEGKRPWQWIDRSNYDYVYAGENLAMDFTSAEAVHEAFMKSPSHRRNILNPKYRDVGIAVLTGRIGDRQTILLVEFFGTTRSAVAPVAASEASVPVAVTQEKTVTAPVTSSDRQPLTAGASIKDDLPSSQAVNGSVVDDQQVEGIIMVSARNGGKQLIDYVIEYSNIFFIAFLIFLMVALALNIFVKIHIQHPSVILQSVAVIALLAAMMLVKFHFLEQISPQLLIL